MLAVLVVVRDFLLAIAFAWIGVSVEQTAAPNAETCKGEACQVQSD